MADEQIVDATDLDWTDVDHGERAFRRKQLGEATSNDSLGCSLYELSDGKRAWPRHYHTGNEEAVFVLEGEGTLYLGPEGEEHTLSAGDYVALPADERGTHEIEGDAGGLRYLVVSTMNEPDITVYPDGEKVGVFAGSAPGGEGDERTLSGYLDKTAELPYWDDE